MRRDTGESQPECKQKTCISLSASDKCVDTRNTARSLVIIGYSLEISYCFLLLFECYRAGTATRSLSSNQSPKSSLRLHMIRAEVGRFTSPLLKDASIFLMRITRNPV